MPLYGSLDVAAALAGAPTMRNLTPDTWSLPGADLVQVSYEVDEGAALTVTPPALHPSIPPYATFTVARFPTSPQGAFNLAMVRLVVRAGIRPRALALATFTDNAEVADELASGWGYPIRTAGVSFQRRYEHITGAVEIDGNTALEVSLIDPEPVAPGDLELFDNLHLTNLADDDPVLVQVDPTYQYSSADRGRADLVTFEPAALGVEGLEPVYRVVAVACTADLELAAPRFVIDPTKPAIEGTRRLTTA